MSVGLAGYLGRAGVQGRGLLYLNAGRAIKHVYGKSVCAVQGPQGLSGKSCCYGLQEREAPFTSRTSPFRHVIHAPATNNVLSTVHVLPSHA